ncbi:TPA: P-type conjugative transfer protein TrbJ [Pseudomonas aeruginosa]|uniref:P-type conjugative transfer protein TrbJ n=1 Tax=Burkholderia multivorans TaxID=87883 RepID=UPI0008415FC4|nr:P-type conjugative transfer protein TrbJ [Burkholderia multivorans]AOJ92614.1 conjugal transfer protein TrbJ [Burkholderia multivorans]MBR7922782.1 P-type conjugative transfer protein TrbJ [Burkholderia multivorans]MBV6099810.1 P-type conjugative transfer protein TrbJ [Pseudomonas aeruginosa]HBO5311225.1 P-type conjugative transfer protein TrbJ [Pseudomonas aeruginosa]
MITLFKKITPTALTVAIAAGMMGGTAALYAPPAHAIYCSNCSTVWNQMMEYAKAVETSVNTARQLQTQIQQYNDMIKQGLSLPSSMFQSFTNDLRRLQSIYNDSRALAHSMSNLDSQFRDQFEGYDNYLKSIGQGTNNMPDRYKYWAQSSFDNARTAMESVGLNTSMFDSEDAVLASLVSRSQTAQGRMQAIQAGNEIAAQQVQQLQKLREMIATNVTLQSNYIAQQTERQAVSDAAAQQFYSRKSQRGPSEGF